MNQKNKNLVAALIILSIILFAFILGILGVFNSIENKILDWRLSLNNTRPINTNIVRLYLDDLSQYDLNGYPDFQNNNKYLSRSILAKLINYVEKGAPELVMIDFDLSKYEDPALTLTSPDIILADTLAKYTNIVIATALKQDGDTEAHYYDEISMPARASLNVAVKDKKIEDNITYNSHSPIPDLFAGKADTAVPSVIADGDTVRYSKPVYQIMQRGKNYFIPSFAFSAFLKHNKLEKESILIEKNKMYVKDYVFNMNDRGEILINQKATGQYYPAFPIGAILKSIYDGTSKFTFNNEGYSSEFFKDKIIIIEELPENLSIKSMPNGEKLTQAETNAEILDSYLTDSDSSNAHGVKFGVKANNIVNVVLTLLFCYLITVANLRFNNRWLGGGLIGLFLLIAFVVFVIPGLRIFLATAVPLYFMLMTFIMTYIIATMTTQEKRSAIANVFENHVSKTVMTKLLKNSDTISLKPDRKFISVMYCNVDEFTNLTDVVPSEMLIERLNEVLDVVIQVSLKNNGTVNKLNNNSVIIYWGAPVSSELDSEGDAKNAIKSGIEILTILSEINKPHEENDRFTLDVNIAVHSGDALVGNIGSQNLWSYTAFGATIDAVYKIEKVCKQFHKNMLVSETSYNLLKTCKNPKLSDKPLEFGYAGSIASKVNPNNKLSLYEVKEIALGQDEEND